MRHPWKLSGGDKSPEERSYHKSALTALYAASVVHSSSKGVDDRACVGSYARGAYYILINIKMRRCVCEEIK